MDRDGLEGGRTSLHIALKHKSLHSSSKLLFQEENWVSAVK